MHGVVNIDMSGFASPPSIVNGTLMGGVTTNVSVALGNLEIIGGGVTGRVNLEVTADLTTFVNGSIAIGPSLSSTFLHDRFVNASVYASQAGTTFLYDLFIGANAGVSLNEAGASVDHSGFVGTITGIALSGFSSGPTVTDSAFDSNPGRHRGRH